MGVELTDGTNIECNILVKCTGFHLNDEIPQITGLNKMQPYGLMDYNLNYGAEPLLDGGQFGGSKDKAEIDLDYSGIELQHFQYGRSLLEKLGFKSAYLDPIGNPFGSGQGGPTVMNASYFSYLLAHP